MLNEVFDGIGEMLLPAKAAPNAAHWWAIALLNLSIIHWSLSTIHSRLCTCVDAVTSLWSLLALRFWLGAVEMLWMWSIVWIKLSP